jgi:hypothetical protein
MRKHRRQLGISVGMPGPHDFAVLSKLFVRSRSARCNFNRPPHPRLNVRDDRETPLCGQAETEENVNLICPTTQVRMRAAQWHDGQSQMDHTVLHDKICMA